ncbi:XdhC family protein [Massilia glaciei]|uniref:XdhC family protein n=1 Tax=Massilia glaciei TaxID=1524097 RepID=A0A2U2HFQ1_9BURK|nr:XdhC family protein [Massilia glaciei]PWF43169.1 XdhC family protein [Massilia glaciei]
MYSTDQQVLGVACRWAAAGHRFALVTVARTWGSAPRPAGALLALRHDGVVEGSVSGGCVEDDLIGRMRAGALGAQAPFCIVYGVTKDEATRFGLPCGGTLELVVEPAPEVAQLGRLQARLALRHLAARRVDLATGAVTLEDALRDDALQWDGSCLTTIHGPQWRLLVIGAGHVSRYLAQMALALDYEIIVCEPRDAYGPGWDVPGTRLLTSMPDDTVTALAPDARTAVVALTHDPKLDDLALLEALGSPAFYVGALGSRVANLRRRERLVQHFDLTQAQVDRMHGPVGIPIGSKTPPEIAVSILAELTAVRNGMRTAPIRDGVISQ